jgi:hypothetical protein
MDAARGDAEALRDSTATPIEHETARLQRDQAKIQSLLDLEQSDTVLDDVTGERRSYRLAERLNELDALSADGEPVRELVLNRVGVLHLRRWLHTDERGSGRAGSD